MGETQVADVNIFDDSIFGLTSVGLTIFAREFVWKQFDLI